MISHVRQEAEFSGKLAEIGSLFKLQSGIVWFLRLATFGLAADAVMLLVARYKAFTPEPWLLGVVAGGLAVFGLLFGLLQRYSPQAIAAPTDQALPPKERPTPPPQPQRCADT